MSVPRRLSSSWAVAATLWVGMLWFPAHAELPAPRPLSVRSDFFRVLDDLVQRNLLSRPEAIYYKVAALRAPELLPAGWRRALEAARPVPGCYTHVMVDAFQSLPHLPEVWRNRIQSLLIPRQDHPYHVQADEPFPLMVSYPDPSLEQGAQTLLDAAEEAYRLEVETWGFWEPLIEPGLGYFRVFYEPTQMGAGGYTAPYDYDRDTPWTDAYTYVVVDSRNPDWFLDGTMAHEFNHTCQAAMDVLEVLAFWENTATYIMSQVFDSAWIYTENAFAAFQATPYRRLEHMIMGASDGYEYGGSLWVLFLEEVYGASDPTWIRRVWEGSVQTDLVNEPDYFDVIDEMLADEGGFGAMVETFGEYRYFVGDRDDGQHLQGARAWSDGTIAVERFYDLGDLPLQGIQPDEQRRPQPNGCNYYELEVGRNVGQPIRFSFDGQDDVRWSVQVFRITTGDTQVSKMELGQDATGILDVEASAGDRLVLAVCQVATPPDYDPDHGTDEGADYTYGIEVLAPEPKVLSVVPDTLPRGVQNVELEIHGEDFVLAPGPKVSFGQDKVVANSVQFVSSELLKVAVVVAASAELGPTDVIVENPGGRRGVGKGLLTIVDRVDQDGGVSGDGGSLPPGKGRGCGCRSNGPILPSLVWLLPTLFVLVRRRRRGHR